jgi:hypothetical protein
MTYILIVAGTALAFYAAAMFIIERENAATWRETELLGSTEPRAPGLWPGVFISALRNLKAHAAKDYRSIRRAMGWVTAMVLTFALMVASILLGLFVAALVLSALETAQQCTEEWGDLWNDLECVARRCVTTLHDLLG